MTFFSSTNLFPIKPHSFRQWQHCNVSLSSYDDLINAVRLFLLQLKPGIRYLVSPKMFLESTSSFIQLGNTFEVDSTITPDMLANLLNFRVEQMLAKMYDINMTDVCVLVYREFVTDVGSSYTNKHHYETLKIDRDVRLRESGVKSSFLSTKYYPFSMDDKDYGVLIKTPAFACDGSSVVNAFVYNRNYLIIRTYKEQSIKSIVYNIQFKRFTNDYNNDDLWQLIEYEDVDKDKIFERKLDNITFKFDKATQKLMHYEVSYDSIKMVEKRKKSFPQSNQFVTLDIETVNINNVLKPCAIGFYDGVCSYTFVLENNDYKGLFKNVFDLLLTSKYDGYIVYVHNLKGFDGVYLVKMAEELGYKVKSSFKSSQSLLQINVSTVASSRSAYINKGKVKATSKRVYNIKIRDSYQLLPISLRSLGYNFDVEYVKSYFPYRFLVGDRLNYIGQIPDKEWWDDDVPEEFYNSKKGTTWILKNELINYLDSDLKCLYGVLTHFAKIIYQGYNLNITEFLTLPALSMGIFRSNFYKDEIIPCLQGHILKDIKNAYYGGVVDVFKPVVTNGYYYDVNSLYPCVMRCFMPIGKPVLTTDKCLDNLFGYAYVNISTPHDLKIPVLPFRDDKGKIYNPLGNWSGWYFTPELLEARDKYGYKIEVIKSYTFAKGENVFTPFVEHFYEIKSSNQTNKALKIVAKLMLNSLYGKFGANPYHDETVILSQKEVEELFKIYEIMDVRHIEHTDKEIVTYKKIPNRTLCDANNVDYIAQLLKCEFENHKNSYISVAIAASITAWGRMYMNTFKMLPGLIYSDTDSIVTQYELNPMYIGPNLGQMKLETKIKIGYFPAPKVYIIKDHDDKITSRAKGLGDIKLEAFYHNLHNGMKQTVNKLYWVKDFEKGQISLVEKAVTLTGVFNKRQKVMNNNKWVDTKPFIVRDGILIPEIDNLSSDQDKN